MAPFVRNKRQTEISDDLAREIWIACKIHKKTRRSAAAQFGVSTSTVDGIASGRKHMDATLELRKEYLARQSD